jgi:hypothetical protein
LKFIIKVEKSKLIKGIEKDNFLKISNSSFVLLKKIGQ